MSDLSDIRKAIQKMSGFNSNVAHVLACTVNSVDMIARTCDVTTITGESEIDIPNVQIMPGVSDGWILTPSVGSMVYIAYSVKNIPFIVMFSEIDAVLLICNNVQVNDGSYGGLVQIANLTEKLNNLVDQINTELPKIATGIATGGGSYTPTLTTEFDQTDYENTKFKHGT